MQSGLISPIELVQMVPAQSWLSIVHSRLFSHLHGNRAAYALLYIQRWKAPYLASLSSCLALSLPHVKKNSRLKSCYLEEVAQHWQNHPFIPKGTNLKQRASPQVRDNTRAYSKMGNGNENGKWRDFLLSILWEKSKSSWACDTIVTQLCHLSCHTAQ